MSHVDIGFMKTSDGNYHCSVEVYQPGSTLDMNVRMSRLELKELRNSLHNTLLELNRELNYED